MILLADTVGDGAVTKEVTEATSEAVQEVGKFAEYVNDNIPELIGFGVRVLLALVVFFIGTKINLLAASDNLLMAIDLADGITFHSTPQWLFPRLLSGKVLPDVHSCRLQDIFLHLPQMHLQSLQ